MRLLLIDHWGGDGMLDIALRCQDDGHEVKWHVRKNGRNDRIGEGLVSRVSDWRDHMRWADLVILADNTKYLREIDAWRANRGVPVVGATGDAAAWELDRALGMKVFKKAGIDIPAFREFHSYDDAIAYVKREGRRFVSKPIGDEGDKALSYVAKGPADLVYMLQRWKKIRPVKDGFILQEHVSGCEIAVGGFFGPHGFNEGWCENFEEKSLCHGGVGPNVGEMGTVLRFVKSSKLADKVLKPLAPHLERIGYVGYVDVNTILDDDGNPWPLEFTMRFGWPTFNIQQALIKGDHATWLADLAGGRDSRPFELNKVATGLAMALPEFPYGKTPIEKVTGVPIYGLEQARDHVHPCSMMMGKAPSDTHGKAADEPMMVTAGDYVLVVTGTGDSIRASGRCARRSLDRLSAPASPIYRTDIGERLKDQLPQIQAKGYARTLTY